MRNLLLVTVLSCAAAVACAKSSAPPAPVPQADLDQMIATVDAFAAVAKADLEDCDKLADDLSKLVDEKRADLDRFRQIKTIPPEQISPHLEQLQGDMGVMKKVIDKCRANAKLKELLKSLPAE